MARAREDLVEYFAGNLTKEAFKKELGEGYDADGLFDKTVEEFNEEEAAEVLAELVLTVNAECDRNDFHNWDYDHLEFIIERSNEFKFSIPKNLLNGLPEQLIILVKSDSIDRSGCE